MSTDVPTPAAAPAPVPPPHDRSAARDARGARRFRASLVLAVAVLALAALVLGLLSLLQGPRLRTAEWNGQAAVSRVGQSAILHFDQAIDPASIAGLEVEPAVPFQVEVDGSRVVVRFEGMLRYASEYRIRLPELTSASTGAVSAIEHVIATPRARLHTLVRSGDRFPGPSDGDAVYSHELGNPAAAELVARAPRIQEYAVLPFGVAMITLDESGAPGVQIAVDGETTLQSVAVPDGAVVSQLRGSGASNLLGFLVETGGEARELWVIDPDDISGVPRIVLGFDGEPVNVEDWAFVAGTTSLVVQSREDDSMLFVELLTDAPPVPLGQFGSIVGFVPGVAQLAVANVDGLRVIDLVTGDSVPVETVGGLDRPIADFYGAGRVIASGVEAGGDRDVGAGEPDAGVVDPGDPAPTDADSDLAQIVAFADFTGSGTELFFAVERARGGEVSILFEAPTANAEVRDICVSPNAQYLAVELVDQLGVDDGYSELPLAGPVTTYFVDLDTGDAALGVAGFRASWCR